MNESTVSVDRVPLASADLRCGAAAWREERGFVGRGGHVVFHGDDLNGWTAQLVASEWEPGCVAIPEDGGPIMVSAGRTPGDGAAEWLVAGEQAAVPVPDVAVTAPPGAFFRRLPDQGDLSRRFSYPLPPEVVAAREADGLEQSREQEIAEMQEAMEILWSDLRISQDHAALFEARLQADRERLDWLQTRLLIMPPSYADLIGLPSRWTSIRDAVDRARASEPN